MEILHHWIVLYMKEEAFVGEKKRNKNDVFLSFFYFL